MSPAAGAAKHVIAEHEDQGAFDNVSVNGLATVTMPAQPGTYELRMLRAASNVLVANEVVTVF